MLCITGPQPICLQGHSSTSRTTPSIVLQVYCLPDGYEVVERSLDDIRYVLNPTFRAQEISRLDQVNIHCYAHRVLRLSLRGNRIWCSYSRAPWSAVCIACVDKPGSFCAPSTG